MDLGWRGYDERVALSCVKFYGHDRYSGSIIATSGRGDLCLASVGAFVGGGGIGGAGGIGAWAIGSGLADVAVGGWVADAAFAVVDGVADGGGCD